MAASPSRADVLIVGINVCYVPEADGLVGNGAQGSCIVPL